MATANLPENSVFATYAPNDTPEIQQPENIDHPAIHIISKDKYAHHPNSKVCNYYFTSHHHRIFSTSISTGDAI